MSVPTCKRCGTKFPGKVICKLCGGDPNTEPTLEEKLTEARAERDHALASVTAGLKVTTKQFVGISRSAKKSTRGIRASQVAMAAVEDEFPGYRMHARRVQRARVRSLQNTIGARRANKHGRKGVR